MLWTDVNLKRAPKDRPYFAKAGGHLLLCTPLGEELHVTSCDQWQYVFKKDELIEIGGRHLEAWIDLDFSMKDTYYPLKISKILEASRRFYELPLQ